MVGSGIGIFVEESGKGPQDGARISVDAKGDVEVLTGGASLGQGFETGFSVQHSALRVTEFGLAPPASPG